MTAMVHPDMGPPPAPKYKDDSGAESPRHLSAPNQAQRPGGLMQQTQHRPDSPRQPPSSLSSSQYASPHPINGISLQQPSPYAAPQDPAYYSSTYPATSVPAPYPSSGPPDLIAATTQMQRPPYPPSVYHTPQSSPPAGLASSQNPDQQGRSLFGQSSQMYAFQSYPSINPLHQSGYPQHSPPHLPMASQPLMLPPQPSPDPMQHPLPQTQPMAISSSTRPGELQQQRSSMPRLPGTTTAPATSMPLMTPSSTPVTQSSSSNSTAAPGPIPATTPLVVHQDANGVQWIEFEYSRDRVKMKYTIRCDVESVDVDSLSPEFKSENCVYPRACCSKDQYKGNRLVYETECNAVGWALAKLNPALRGKRGLIQRAVDSWRNSNQDIRLRSRRVRRMAKMNRRQSAQQNQPSSLPTLPSPAPSITHGLSGVNPSLPQPTARPAVSLPLASSSSSSHPQYRPDDSIGNEDVRGTAYVGDAQQRPLMGTAFRPIILEARNRAGQSFQSMSGCPSTTTRTVPSMTLPSGAGGQPGRTSNATTATCDDGSGRESWDYSPNLKHQRALFGDLPEGKRRKFILVDDPQRGCRVRVKVMLNQVDMDEIPDSYRLSNAVYPRAYFPVQLKRPPGRVVPGKRYLDDHTDDHDGGDDDEDKVTVGRTLVPAPSLDGEVDIAVPRLSRSRHRKDDILNELGYRMSWSQSRMFAGRPGFLQRSLDAYRNKMHNTMVTIGHDPASIPSHFETRPGRRRWLERRRLSGRSARDVAN